MQPDGRDRRALPVHRPRAPRGHARGEPWRPPLDAARRLADAPHLRCAHALAAPTLRRRDLDVTRQETVRLHARRPAFTYAASSPSRLPVTPGARIDDRVLCGGCEG